MLTYQLIEQQIRQQYLNLLLIGDEDLKMVERYYQKGDLWAIYQENILIGVCHFLPKDKQCLTLQNISLKPEYQRQGYGSKVLTSLTAHYQKQYAKLQVGTGDGSLGAMKFYLQNGFRFETIQKDFFKAYQKPIIENGILLQDMVIFEKKLN